MFNTIRWKFLSVFAVLVMVATILLGVLVVQFFEEYNIKSVDDRLDSLSNIMLSDLFNLEDLERQKYIVDTIIHNKQYFGFSEEIYIISNNKIIASSSNSINELPEEILDIDLLIAGLNKQKKYKILNLPLYNEELKVIDKIYPINNIKGHIGELYLRYDLRESQESLEKIKSIIIKTMFLVIFITILISTIISNSITEAIKDIAISAKNMAKGNFKNKLSIKSDDEFGELAKIFNTLSYKLDSTLTMLYSENSKLDTIVNNIGDGIIVFDLNKEIVLINNEAKKIFSKYQYLSYKTFISFLPELDIENISDVSINNTMIQINKNFYEVRVEFYNNIGSEKTGYIYVLKDVTKRENLEKLRREFIANVSHELKTPITSIRAYSETLLDNHMYKNEMGHKFLNVINEESIRMTKLVNDLLNLSNYDTNNIVLNIKEFNFCDLIENIILKLDVIVKEKKQKIIFEKNVETCLLKNDYERLEQVIINLITNSVKYSEEGKKIKIKLLNFETKIYLKIIDQGMGIKKEDIVRLFERFYRVDNARTRIGGSGLGLTIVKEILDMLSVDININSFYNIGTVVTLKFNKNE